MYTGAGRLVLDSLRMALRGFKVTRVLAREEQVKIWSALSEVFVDNHVDYAWIACQVKDLDRSTVEAAFFEDVAPACYSNLMTPVPPIWTGFDETWLAGTIEASHQARRVSALRRLLDRVLIGYLRFRFKSEWAMIERELEQLICSG